MRVSSIGGARVGQTGQSIQPSELCGNIRQALLKESAVTNKKPAEAQGCVFCGAAPNNKTKEHVIPKWLIELTGDPKLPWSLGVRFGEEDEKRRQRRFAADQFQFPACADCNLTYSRLEARAKSYVTKLLAGEPLSAQQWDDLLDWFDKVRIGLWLGMRRLNPEVLIEDDPKFHIDQRIGQKGRCVLVYRINASHKGLIMHGAGDPFFLNWPSCFALTVNDLMFVNLSNDYLLSARMGFPFPRKLEEVEDRMYASHFTAFYRTKTPLIRFSFHPAPIAVYQAVLMKVQGTDGKDKDDCVLLQYNAFIQDLLIPGSDCRSLIHSSDGVTTVACAPETLIEERTLADDVYRHGAEYLVRFFEYRDHMLDDYINSGRNPSAAPLIRSVKRFNRRAIEQIGNELEEWSPVRGLKQ